MNKFIYRIIIWSMALLCFGCAEKTPDDTGTPESYGFDIEIYDLHSSHCKVKVTPENMDEYYFLGVATEEYLSGFGSLDNMEETAVNFIETQFLENLDMPVTDMLHKGVYERDVTGLQPCQTFVVFACYTDETGSVVSEVKKLMETTPEVADSKNLFDIEIDQITATNAMLFITPSNDDDYVWMELPDYVYNGMTENEIRDFLLKNYKPFFPLHTNSGEMVHSFDDKLDPDTEYMIIVFGYDGGMTTPLTIEKFRTLKPNDATNTTFTFEYSGLTSRNVKVTFTPSDKTVSYLAIVAEESLFEKFGGADEEGVKALIDLQIRQSILFGDCEDRAEFAQFYAKRGVQTGSFSLEPGLKHYTCAVCVDENGDYASAVAIDEFIAPDSDQTDASASARFDKYFDGDALAALDAGLYGDYAGWAVLPVRFSLEGSAVDAIYTIYPVEVLEEEGATDDVIRGLMLDDELLGEYNFFIESKVDVQLEWDCDYRLFILGIDGNDNVGELVKIDIPALKRDGASPVSEY